MPQAASPPTGSLATALRQAVRLLAATPHLAEAQAREILAVIPGNPQALLVLGQARAAQKDWEGARDILDALCRSQKQDAAAHAELGAVLARLGNTTGAIAALQRAVALSPKLAGVWRDLGDLYLLAGDAERADQAYAQHILASVNDPRLLEAARALCDNKLAVAERVLREFLKQHPTDVAAIRMLAETGSRLGRYEDAERLLARCLELAPNFRMARQNYATVLYRQNKCVEAIAEADRLLEGEPGNAGFRALKAAALGQIGEYAKAVEEYERLLGDQPAQPKAWMSYGHALKALGRRSDCTAAYRKSVALLPSLGEAWWSLANLKTRVFDPADIAAMKAQLARPDLNDEDRWHLHFALGKAFEDDANYPHSFEHYREGNRLRRLALDYDAAEIADHVDRSCAFFTRAFFDARSGQGSPAPDPIFIVGLPRAGSTLVEQILASHSLVEGTMELPDIVSLARRLGGKMKRSDRSDYPEALADLDSHAVRALGDEYLARTRIHRRLARPFFIDKMPNNFAHAGLIHLILPKAKIIDVRRHPIACGFSLYKQHFARGQGFSYDLEDIGRYYTDYVRLMAHFDAVLPGRIHRVVYEELTADFEGEVRRLLAHCGLPFEEACLRFHENARPVRTASSEQVRQPIFTNSLEHWRHYEAWLDPLKSALSPVLSNCPAPAPFA
ncbi:MAG TPA: sulfotransferase [Rhizomicrobium sp.]|nr:sulfotransferase [Rhizomicrobium sp.]